MTTGFLILGCMSVFYYLLLIYYTKHIRTTFSWFWVVFAVFCFGLSRLYQTEVRWLLYICNVLLLLGLCVFILITAKIIFFALPLQHKNMDYILVLGAQVRGVRVSDSLKRRLDRAIQYLRQHPDTDCIVSGGRGRGEEVTEAFAMSEYLKEYGIDSDRIILEDASTSTYENFEYSKSFLPFERNVKVGIVTNHFHMYRARKIAKRSGYRKVYAIPAGCHPVLLLNYVVRECFAVIGMYIKF